MAVSSEMRAKALEVKYHQRKALQFIARGQPHRVSKRMLTAMTKAGLLLGDGEICGEIHLSQDGKKLHDALNELGWFPPDKDDLPPDRKLGKKQNSNSARRDRPE
ncbi:hypothetical protein [Aliihoeflea sp. PC F10.4]